jgi:uncharacterized protein YjeT (DUF2065 family)
MSPEKRIVRRQIVVDKSFQLQFLRIWILAGLGYFLTPVLQRFAATAATTRPGRTLDVVRGAELVAVPAAEAGEDAMVRSEGGRLTVRVAGREVELGEDEVLLVRPHQARPGPG